MELKNIFIVFSAAFLLITLSYAILLISFQKDFEAFGSLVPITIYFEDVILIDESKDYVDYFLKEKLEGNFDVEVNVDKNSNTLQLCKDEKCLFKLSQDVDMSKYNGPAILNNVVRSENDRFIRIRPKQIEEFDNDIVTYLALGIKLVLNSTITINKPVSVKSLYSDAISNNNVEVYFDKSDAVKMEYDLYICKWTDEKKEAICQLNDWAFKPNTPDISIGKSRAFDVIRIKRKNKNTII